jgi:formylglycine-generating enzyme required for sulfatase activity
VLFYYTITVWKKRTSLNEMQVQRMAILIELEMIQLVVITYLGILIVTGSSFSASAEKRFALLIGNKNYGPQVGTLKNPHKDIALIDKALQQVGFSVVSKKDLGRVEMHRQINEYIERLSKAGPGAVGFFYYVGHGVSNPYDRSNYLIPIDIQTMQDPDLWVNALPLDRLLRDLERGAPNAAHIVVFDACRNELRLPVRTGVKGFEPVTAMRGMFIAFSTSPNTAASDVGDDSGPYAQALASELIRPRQDHLTLFQNVKERVINATGGTQWPWESNGLLRFYFVDKPLDRRETSTPVSPPLDKLPAVSPPQEITTRLGMTLVRIPAGEFQMGSKDGDPAERPAHHVRISEPFYLGKYEVTQAQWEAVMGTNHSTFKGHPRRPVEMVSWEDVQEFITRLNKQEGWEVCRLPTEAQWEYAARAGTTTDRYENDVDAIAWYGGNSGKETHEVGQKRPNAWGLYDMLGNVSEWCHDGRRTYSNENMIDPMGSTGAGADRVIRGGSWSQPAQYMRAAYRSWFPPGFSNAYLGFRCASSGPSK